MSGSTSCLTASSGKTQLWIDSQALEPWQKIADVLGLSLGKRRLDAEEQKEPGYPNEY